MTIQFAQSVPVFRIYSIEKALEFYVDFLGCRIDREHRFEEGGPVHMRVSRDALAFHLSEHFGDGTPGSLAYVYVTGIAELHRELIERKYRHARPMLQNQDWGMVELTLTDPFNNRIVFGEPTELVASA